MIYNIQISHCRLHSLSKKKRIRATIYEQVPLAALSLPVPLQISILRFVGVEFQLFPFDCLLTLLALRREVENALAVPF